MDSAGYETDVVVVGGGHNGLTSAAYLAVAGKRVTVLEAAPVIGGYCSTERPVAAAPDHMFSRYALEHVAVNLPPSVSDELNLQRYGLRYVKPDPFVTVLANDGSVVALWQNLDRTCNEIRRFSPRDAEQYRRLMVVLRDFLLTALPYFNGDPRRLSLTSAVEILRRGIRARKSLGTALRVLLDSPLAVLDDWFERDEVKAAIAMYALFGLAPLDTPGNMGMVFLPMVHEFGLTRPVGGSGAFPEALVQCIRGHGGVVRTSALVEEVEARNGHVEGVRLASGEQIRAQQVIGAVDPVTLISKLVTPNAVPPEVTREVRRIRGMVHNLGIFKADIALDSRPTWPRHMAEFPISDAVLVPSMDFLHRSVKQASAGELPDRPPVQLWLPSVVDPSLAPGRSECLYLSAIVVPREFQDGSEWASVKDKYLDRCLDVVEDYSPGISKRILGTSVLAPDDLDKCADRGNPYHVDMTITALGPWRPTPSLSGYRTPIEGLWHTGAGAHPMPGISGIPGRTAARLVQKAGKSR